MCGLAGVVAQRPEMLPDEATLLAMGERLRHRGPDGQGMLRARGARSAAALVHRRLAVLDPTPRADQPFSTMAAGRRVHLVFNGEIYNFRELRQRITRLSPDFAWRTTGDTEVLLAAYIAWGEACVDELVGMFAFAVFDEGDGSLLLARDRLGQKPLYYAVPDDDAVVAFASELPALLPLPWVKCDLDEQALAHYLAFGYTPTAGSICRGIAKLPPGHLLRWTPDGRSPNPRRYWTPPRPGSGPVRGVAEAAAEVRQRVQTAVTRQLVSDAPLGCFLSGGIDSAVVAACAQAEMARQGASLRTFTVAFDDPRYDESAAAEDVARHLGTHHTVMPVSLPRPAEALDLLVRVAESYGEPFGDSSALPTYLLCREARRHVTVALAGDGGDELFGGYDRYRAMHVAERWRGLWGLPGVAALGRRLARGHPKSSFGRLGRFLAAAALPAAQRYELWMRLFPPGLWRSPPLTGRVGGVELPAGFDPRLAAMALDRETYLDGDLLTKVDRASMRFGLEVRAPFLDHPLVELAASMPADVLFPPGHRGGKALLKLAFARDLPPGVFTRPKRGFAVPVGEWFRGGLEPVLRDVLLGGGVCVARFGRTAVQSLIDEHVTGRTDHTQRLFAAMMLELWHGQARPTGTPAAAT
ncbi:MAG: asparagine synthase (glutamine-hydrolyzing) [Tepidisphaerales bacterium]